MPYTIEKFLGVNKSATETLLQLGEASKMVNWFVTDDYKIQKMFGYVELFDTLGAHKINGMWYGSLGGTNHFVFACNGHVYEHNLTTGEYRPGGGNGRIPYHLFCQQQYSVYHWTAPTFTVGREPAILQPCGLCTHSFTRRHPPQAAGRC
jgi:hypothetical protein